MQIVALKNGVASEVATRVKALYQDQVKGIQGGGIADAVILGDDTSGRVIVTASETHMKLIQDIIGKLQEASSKPALAGRSAGGSEKATRARMLNPSPLGLFIALLRRPRLSRVRRPARRRTLRVSGSGCRTMRVSGSGCRTLR